VVVVIDYLGLLLAAILGLAALRELPRIWNSHSTQGDHIPRWWPWGDALWRAWVRSLPMLVLAFVVIVFIAAFGTAVMASVDKDDSLVERVVFLFPIAISLVVLVALFVLIGMIVLFNQPKAAVPPRARHQPGALREWRSREGNA
jgi:ABC-type amino acid transport system permease subunit